MHPVKLDTTKVKRCPIYMVNEGFGVQTVNMKNIAFTTLETFERELTKCIAIMELEPGDKVKVLRVIDQVAQRMSDHISNIPG